MGVPDSISEETPIQKHWEMLRTRVDLQRRELVCGFSENGIECFNRRHRNEILCEDSIPILGEHHTIVRFVMASSERRGDRIVA